MIVTRVGSIGVAAGREAVWTALHDADRIALCVPGCRQVVDCGNNNYAVTAVIRFGPVRITFDGTVVVSDFEEPVHLSLTGRGNGGLAGAASGTAIIKLTERCGGCRLTYDLHATTDGPVARLGSTFLTGLAAVLVDRFTRRFAELFEDPGHGRHAPTTTRTPTISPAS